MSHPIFIFVHGWSYDAHFWTSLQQALPPSLFLNYDEGYYHPKHIPTLPDRPYWAIGHSAGLMRLLQMPHTHCRGLISFNGFACFAQKHDFPNGVPRRIIERMHKQLAINPHQIIENFRQLCGDHTSPIPSNKNIFQLQLGLETLIKEDHREKLTHLPFPIYDITSPQDPLSPARYGISANLPQKTSITKIPAPIELARDNIQKLGHLLPLTHPHLCAKLIKDILMI